MPALSRGGGIAYGLLVTFLWSTSYVLIKWGVEELTRPYSFHLPCVEAQAPA